MNRILLTGTAGFIGSHLSEKLLEEGYSVIGLDNFDPFYDRKIKERNLSHFIDHPNFTFQEIDFCDMTALQTIPEFDMVIHLAAKAGVRPSIENPGSYIQTNIQGTNNILELMRQRKVHKMVFASSSSVYGNNTKIPFTETDEVNGPISPYAFSKRSCELMNYTYHSLYNMDILNLRFFTVYGPRQRPDLAIHKFVRKIQNGEGIQMFGDGSSARDYTFIHDTIDGIFRALKYVENHQNVYEIINLGNHTPVKLSELINTIDQVTEQEMVIEQLPMQAGDVNITYANIDKAQELLGYMPKTSIHDGLKKFVEWYDEVNAY
ncbi:GDP-mannose 4,6-dehydratase [Algivirga pacifica]|uniref:GDP-mannose 4,6-dehydratase n=1 Tax=Algivirga pacifica TaxID=1162670 RepID=A0ABP9D5A0_9BACT